MNQDEDRETATQLFLRARELTQETRGPYLDDACRGDGRLRAEVESLLARDGERLRWTSSREAAPIVPGYAILRRVGKGGMGEVYEAEQEGPLHRIVAIKVIRPGMNTREVLARFEVERRALALMNHPNVAKVFDAGNSDDGHPFFAMEFVNGVPITAFCDEHALTARQRLELFVLVCDGVQHAHQKGVIHRDIKPSNVLISVDDEHPAPKIIDFGIAKAIDRELTERTLTTEFGRIVGTPEYMSPEQADANTVDIDTRSDVYSLGVLLYELLVGVLPFDADDPRNRRLDELRRRIQHEEARRPSLRLQELGATAEDICRRRGSEPRTLARQIRGDLDWILMKCLEKDRDRRYETASALAQDLVRHLRDEPVRAGPPSASYRITKFVRRHRLGVAAAAAIAAALLVGVSGLALGFHRARVAESRAVDEARTASQVTDFLIGLFQVSDPTHRAKFLTVRDLLDQGTAKIRADLTDQPRVRARILDAVGVVYGNLAMYDKAIPLLDEALSLRTNVLAPDNFEVGRSLNSKARTLYQRGDYRGSAELFEKAIKTLESAAERNPTALVSAREGLANAVAGLGDLSRATQLYEAVILDETARGYPDEIAYVGALTGLAQIANKRDDFAAARTSLERAMHLLETNHGPDYVALSSPILDLATTEAMSGNPDRALDLGARALKIRASVYGPKHPEVAFILNAMGNFHNDKGEFALALPLWERALQIFRESLGEENPVVAHALNNVGIARLNGGDPAAAAALFRQAEGIFERTVGQNHPDRAMSLANLGNAFAVQGKLDDARKSCAEAARIDEAALGPDSSALAADLYSLAEMEHGLGDFNGARRDHERALAIRRKSLPAGHPDVGASLSGLGGVEFDAKRVREATHYFEDGLVIQDKALGLDHPYVAETLFGLAQCLVANGDLARASSRFDRAVAIYDKSYGPGSTETKQRIASYLKVLGRYGHTVEAERWQAARDRVVRPSP
jgi:non-specific serine/threonine protein kinase/serine/threonine-protein kinase